MRVMSRQLNCYLKKFFIFLFITLAFFSNYIYSDETKNNVLTFSWAFIYKNKNNETKTIDPYQPINQLETGDKIKIFVQPGPGVYTYIFLYDAQRELGLIFPQDFEEVYARNVSYFIPPGKTWFVLDEYSGIEKFYILASNKRLNTLENLTVAYLGLLKGRSITPDKIERAKIEIIEKIESLIKENNEFLFDIVESPLQIAGEWRQLEDEFQAMEIKGKEFYAKKIRIQH